MLDRATEWPDILQVFSNKMLTEFEQSHVIKGITSFSLANIGDTDEFWRPTFELVNQKVDPAKLDSFIKMNLLWTMARNVTALSEDLKEDLISKVVPDLHKDIAFFIKN